MIRVPTNVPPEIQQIVREINNALNKIIGANNSDFKGRRIINAGNAQDMGDYVTMADVHRIFDQKTGVINRAKARKLALQASIGEGGGGGVGGGSGPGLGSVTPLVDLADLSGDVETYAAANSAALLNSCQTPPATGDWTFMDGLVAYLQAIDERVGFNGKRGDVADPSQDAIAYYHGALPPVSGSNNVYVVDVIAGHCGTSPSGAWQNVTRSDTAGAWLATR